ncbi:MAG: glucose-1-phosphate adenylyltransferase [Thermoflexales bacterium]|nr:glucose-1-phosphate adenylyltransferase [Thermoflexales bacterium]
MIALNNVLAVILGGGRGSRLYPLTKMRSKPAVPIAGKYRLIDIPISNCINAGIYRIAILTQFNSVSLHRHITHTYNFDAFHTGWVQILAAEQTPDSVDWYQGTADAVRKQLFEIRATGASHVLILAGDHLYRMDYAAMVDFHDKAGAEITVAVQPIARQDAARYGLLKRDAELRIVDFVEKPKDPAVLADFVSRDDPERPYLGSMGIYLFNTDTMIALLQDVELADFGSHVIPSALQTRPVFGFDFDDYWVDIGTMRSFYETNLALASPQPPFNFYDPNRPIYSHPRFLPGSTVEESALHHVVLAEGGCIRAAKITHSVIGVRSQIGEDVTIADSIVMGADYYDPSGVEPRGGIPLGIGPRCQIEGAILDKNVRMGADVVIRPFPDNTNIDTDHWVVRDGIVVVPKSTVIPPNTFIGPGSSD